jgi:hypothetical protein
LHSQDDEIAVAGKSQTYNEARGADMERELDQRSADGIDVTLLWHDDADAVLVAVENEQTGELLRIGVEPADALDAFRHPFAYARRGGSVDSPGRSGAGVEPTQPRVTRPHRF